MLEDRAKEECGMTLKEAMEKYNEVKEGVIAPSTYRTYEITRKNAFQSIEDLKISDIDSAVIANWVGATAKHNAPKTVKNKAAYLSSVMSLYAPEKRLEFKLPPKKKVDYHITTDDEICSLLALTKDNPLGLAVRLAIFIPARRSEICALTYEDINNILYYY